MGNALPKRIGRFDIESVIGRGAMGIVYRAHDPEIDRPVAIKLIAASLLEGDQRTDFLERFRREARAAGRCAHPNVVAIYDLAMHEGNPFLAMEYVEGTSLAEALARDPASVRERAAPIALGVLAALEAAHALGIVHRDIKPANILIDRAGRVKVTDFGVARLDRSEMTGTGLVIGSLSYMAPEQCRAEPVDARADLFSLGAVFYQMLTGGRPFTGSSDAEVMQNLLYATPKALAHPALLHPFAPIVARALAKAPAERFPDAASMAAAIRAAPAEPDEGTVIAAPPPRAPAAPSAEPDPASLTTIERRLAEHIGPIAHHLVQKEQRRNASLAGLRDSLSSRIDDPAARARFLRDTERIGSGSSGPRPPPAATTGFSDAFLAAAERALAHHLGPIATVLVRREAARAGSPEALWSALAARIEAPQEREAFLRRQPR